MDGTRRHCILILSLGALTSVAGCAESRESMAPTGSRSQGIDVVKPAESREAIPPGLKLEFVSEGGLSKTLSVTAYARAHTPRIVTIDDPNHHHRKSYLALPLLPLLVEGFGISTEEMHSRKIIMEALDGYASPVSGEVLTRAGAFLAIDDIGYDGWEPIGDKRADPAPLYVVWHGEDRSPERFPWPWALTRVRIAELGDEYEAVELPARASARARRGHELFLARCIRCHAINRAGGRVGPELNVPRNITEYRPASQIIAFIRDPQSFRYSAMPANPDLTDRQLGDLLAYLRAMKNRKIDLNSD